MAAITTVFTNPAVPAPNHIDLLKTLINNAKGDIYLVVNFFKHKAIADALNAASARGVNVRAIIRCDNEQPLNTLEAIRPFGCFGGAIHTKLFLFSETRLNGSSAKHLAVAGSFTVTNDSVTKHQNAVCIEDEQLYNDLVLFWFEMAIRAGINLSLKPSCVEGTAIDCSRTKYSKDRKVKAYLFPFRSSDPVLQVINNFEGKRGNNNERPLARIAMARWTKARDGLLNAIKAKLDDGVRFRMVLRVDEQDGVHPDIFDELLEKKVALTKAGRGDDLQLFRGEMQGAKNVHSKYVTYKGFYDRGSDWNKIVWTGSENWTKSALLGNDEIMLKITHSNTYDDFAANFLTISGLM